MQIQRSFRLCLFFCFPLLLSGGCSLLAADYSVSGDDPQDRDPDGTDGISDGGDAPSDPGTCSPAGATAAYMILKGPATSCGVFGCEGWGNLCFAWDRHYLVRQVMNGRVRWFDRCNLAHAGAAQGLLSCTSEDGMEVEIRADGSMNLSASSEPNDEWSLFHRSVQGYGVFPAKNGCGSDRCEMFDGFVLDASHRYFAGRTEASSVVWYMRCHAVFPPPPQTDQLVCLDDAGRRLVFSTGSLDESDMVFTGAWTLYSELLDGDPNRVYRQASGCGSKSCDLWDGFDLSAEFRYMLMQSDSSGVRLFDSCSGFRLDESDPSLRCASSDGHTIELQTSGDERSDLVLAVDSQWVLLRWSLATED